MAQLQHNRKTGWARPVSPRLLKLGVLVIVLLEVVLFTASYAARVNPVKKVTTALPLPGTLPFAGPSAPAPEAVVYSPFEKPLSKPMGVAVVNRRIYVTDTNNQRVQIFDYDGRPLGSFGSNGQGEGQFRFPYGVAGDSQGRLYIADLYNNNISVFDQDGKFIRYLGAKGDLTRPGGLFIDGDRLYVTDIGSSRVLVYALDGTKLLAFGSPGQAPGQMSSPNGIFHTGGRIYVTDTGNDRVQVFDDRGQPLLQFDGRTADKNYAKIINPRGITVDAKGTIYVVSNLTSKVEAFNQKGEPVYSFGSMGDGEGQFQLPNGLCLDDQGRLYVTDTVGNRLVVFQS